LRAENLVDERYRVHQAEGRVHVPVTDAEAARALVDGEIGKREVEPNPMHAPIGRVRDRLAGELDEEELAALPEGWTQLGDVLVLRLPDELEERGERVGRAYADALDVSAVVEHRASRGELRQPDTRVLVGEATRAVHREHGLDFHLDPTEVMFSPGNEIERHRLKDAVEPGQRVVDLFAGIGYFTLPLAQAGARVFACEKRPAAARFLARNAVANGLDDRVRVRVGDCRTTAPTGLADRVLMGYFPGTEAFLETAVDALSPQGGWLHYHDRVDRANPLEEAREAVLGHPALADRETRVERARVVKSLDPLRVHAVVDVRVDA